MADNLKNHLDIFTHHLQSNNRLEAIQYGNSLLESGVVTVPELYEQILAPSLNSILIGRGSEHDLIWREHVMTAIVRSIVESALPYVLKERERYLLPGFFQKVMLVCPEEEYHDLGIRMGADFFTIAGYDVTYIGSNTPKSNILSATRYLKPNIIGISVSNYLNLVMLEKIIPQLKQEIDKEVKIIVSGSAFKHTGRSFRDFQADGIVNEFTDILAMRGHTHEDSD